MIAELLSAQVCCDEIFGADPSAYLLPDEQVLVARAVEKRRREVTNARTCARRALAELGIAETPILRGDKGEPLWPTGVVGSITHTNGYHAAAVADSSKIRSIGIDAEVHDALPAGVLRHIALDKELDHLAELGTSGGIWWERLLFSAKESVYKAWFPLAKRWLGFEDALITMHPDAGSFTARILVDGATVDGLAPLSTLSGRFAVSEGYILTTIVLPSD